MAYTDEDLEHMSVCTSQYDSTCRELAAELLISRRQLRKICNQHQEEILDMMRDARDAVAEARWQAVQGEDYSNY